MCKDLYNNRKYLLMSQTGRFNENWFFLKYILTFYYSIKNIKLK